jgi:hypothetical protein
LEIVTMPDTVDREAILKRQASARGLAFTLGSSNADRDYPHASTTAEVCTLLRAQADDLEACLSALQATIEREQQMKAEADRVTEEYSLALRKITDLHAKLATIERERNEAIEWLRAEKGRSVTLRERIEELERKLAFPRRPGRKLDRR